MKRIISTIITIVLLLQLVLQVNAVSFPDVSSQWYSNYVYELVNMNVIDGYPDGTFGPYNSIKVDEFIKLAVASLGYVCENGEGYWAAVYVEKARELGLVEDRDFDKYTRPIVRGEMARIVVRALGDVTSLPDNLDTYKSCIKDYQDIPLSYRDYVLKGYGKGIIKGYPDGRFGWSDNANRAEAAAMIYRMLKAKS